MKLSINKQKEKDWTNLIKDEAKINGWKFKSFFAYRVDKFAFYKVNFFISGIDNSISTSFSFKPLIVDETFWNIVDLSQNSDLPMSFRGNGAFVMGSKIIFDLGFKVENDTLKDKIKMLFEKTHLKLNEIKENFADLESFISFVENYPNKRSEWFDVDILIVIYITQTKYENALQLLNYAKNNRGMCSWSFGKKSFYDLAIEHCHEKQRSL